MRDALTGDDLANEVRMAHTRRAETAFLLVEGATDSAALRSFLESSRCEIIVCHNRANALRALAVLDEAHEPGFVVLVDADFDRLEGRPSPSLNCVLTEFHDLIVVLFCSSALDRLLVEHASLAKVQAYVEAVGSEVRESLLRNATPLGYLRWLNERSTLGLRFRDVSLDRFTSERSLEMDAVRLIEVIAKRSKCPQEIAVLQEGHHALSATESDPRQVVCGHDVVELLSLGLRSTLGSRKAADVRPEALERELRLAFDRVAFEGSALHADLRAWEERNPSWRILPVGA